MFTWLQASPARFPGPCRFSSRYDAAFPSAAWYGSSIPSAWYDTTFPCSLRNTACVSWLDTYSAFVVRHASPRIGSAHGAAPANTPQPIARPDEPGDEEEDSTQVL